MAVKFTKSVAGNDDGVVVFGLRQVLKQPLEAPDWLDLRVGWLLSITRANNNDDISNTPTPNIVENIGADNAMLPWSDRYGIGLTDLATGNTFAGFTNRGTTNRDTTVGGSKVVSSDAGVGTTNSNYYRPKNAIARGESDAMIVDRNTVLARSRPGVSQHFAQTLPGAGGYATLLMLRFQRPDHGTNAKRITMTIPMVSHPPVTGTSADVAFTDNPSEIFLRTSLQLDFPSPVMQLGPVTLSQVPDTFYVYWPFINSKLRIHAMGLAKAR